ncbi:MAG: carboxypeptidase-like regulatory domain-containing protein [Chitinophagales bacterium]|nr:carboxypeptidase-like regulatory domain-containing protein [Bacteroidota bacterium]MCB9226770.1 carboxypeptidase-like regulatory domain-containing protein [Chitinophagales bacterium]
MKYYVLLFITLFGVAKAQDISDEIIQFSGYILTPDTLMGIPFASIKISGTNRGTMSNEEGFFSFAAKEGDTILFSCIGFKDSKFAIPTDLQTNKYSIVKLMTTNTYYLDTVRIYPWPTKDMFKQAFLSLDKAEETDTDRALRNLEREYLKEMGENLAYDGRENSNYYLRSEARKFYYAGQAPPQNIFNVFAWAQFIEAWKRGDFKRKAKK